MKEYAPFHPDHEFLGRTIVNMQEALGSQLIDIQQIFAEHGLGDVDPDKWYPAHKWFDVMNNIAEAGIPNLDFTGIGMKSVKKRPDPR